jgi:hypothetical protein
LQYDCYTLATAVEAAVIQRVPDAEDRLASATSAAAENRWAAACLARATGRHTGNITSLEEAVAGWDNLKARFERAITLLLIPGREMEAHDELDALGCPPPLTWHAGRSAGKGQTQRASARRLRTPNATRDRPHRKPVSAWPAS